MNTSPKHSIWCMRANSEIYDVKETIWDDGLGSHTFVNGIEHSQERFERARLAGITPPLPASGTRYERFDNLPWLSIDVRYHPDYFSDRAHFVSPKLLPLLDQPMGSLQALPTRTDWRLGEPLNWAYWWLSYIPLVSVIDLERSDAEVEYTMELGKRVPRVTINRSEYVLHNDLNLPCSTFRAAEDPGTLLVTDAVAEAALRAGCVGIDFVEVETAYAQYGPLRRRTLHGVELHARNIERRRQNGIPVPDA